MKCRSSAVNISQGGIIAIWIRIEYSPSCVSSIMSYHQLMVPQVTVPLRCMYYSDSTFELPDRTEIKKNE